MYTKSHNALRDLEFDIEKRIQPEILQLIWEFVHKSGIKFKTVKEQLIERIPTDHKHLLLGRLPTIDKSL